MMCACVCVCEKRVFVCVELKKLECQLAVQVVLRGFLTSVLQMSHLTA